MSQESQLVPLHPLSGLQVCSVCGIAAALWHPERGIYYCSWGCYQISWVKSHAHCHLPLFGPLSDCGLGAR